MSTASRDCIHLANIARAIGEPIIGAVPLACDSQPAITQALDPHFRTKLRSIAQHWHIIKDHVRDELIDVIKMGTKFNVSDIMTKRIPIDLDFVHHADSLLEGGKSEDGMLRIFTNGFGVNHDKSIAQALW